MGRPNLEKLGASGPLRNSPAHQDYPSRSAALAPLAMPAIINAEWIIKQDTVSMSNCFLRSRPTNCPDLMMGGPEQSRFRLLSLEE